MNSNLQGSTRVYLTIYGINPSEVTRRLGISPRKTGLAGSRLRSGVLTRDMWEISEASDEELADVMDRLLQRLRPSWDELLEIVESAEEIEMEAAIYNASERPSPFLRPDAMAALGALRPQFQISLY